MMELLNETTIRSYLLGALPELERDEFEHEWFGNKVKYYELCEAENNLIDDYVRGHLTDEERQLFTVHFLAIPARQERVATAKTLLREIDQQVVANPIPSRWKLFVSSVRNFKPVPAFAVMTSLLLIAFGFWYFRKSNDTQIQIAKTGSTNPPVQIELPKPMPGIEPKINATSPKPIPQPTKIATPATENKSQVSLPLTMLLRDADGNSLPTLKLANGATRVKLQIPLPANEYQQYRAILRTAEGAEITRWNNVKAIRTKNVSGKLLELETKNLKAGDYLLVINGLRASGESEEFRRIPFQARK